MDEVGERKTRRIIVAEEMHGYRYLDAATDEMWARSALVLLTERFLSGNDYFDPFADRNVSSSRGRAERDALLEVREDVIMNLPPLEQDRLRTRIEAAKKDLKKDEAIRDEYLEVKQAVESKDLSWWGKGRMARPTVWDLLTRRSEEGDKQLSLEFLEIPEIEEKEVSL